MVDSWSRGLDYNQMFPDRDTVSNVLHGGKWRDRRREKYCQVLPAFFFVNEHNNANTKPQAKKQRFLKLSQKFPEEKQQLVEEKDADTIRKVLCKSFIQWFRELLQLPSRLFWFAPVILWFGC